MLNPEAPTFLPSWAVDNPNQSEQPEAREVVVAVRLHVGLGDDVHVILSMPQVVECPAAALHRSHSAGDVTSLSFMLAASAAVKAPARVVPSPVVRFAREYPLGSSQVAA